MGEISLLLYGDFLCRLDDKLNNDKMPKLEQSNMGAPLAMSSKSEKKPGPLISNGKYNGWYVLPEEITESTTIMDVCSSIANNPNLWGIYSIHDAFKGLVEMEVQRRLTELTP